MTARVLFENGAKYDAGDFASYFATYATDGVVPNRAPTFTTSRGTLTLSEFSAIFGGYLVVFDASTQTLPAGDDELYTTDILYLSRVDDDITLSTYHAGLLASTQALAKTQAVQAFTKATAGADTMTIAYVTVGHDTAIEAGYPVATAKISQYEATVGEFEQGLATHEGILYKEGQKGIQQVLDSKFPHVSVIPKIAEASSTDGATWTAQIEQESGYTAIPKALVGLNGRLLWVVDAEYTNGSLSFTLDKQIPTGADVKVRMYMTKTD